jgi:chromosome transmission fidelity protein 4
MVKTSHAWSSTNWVKPLHRCPAPARAPPLRRSHAARPCCPPPRRSLCECAANWGASNVTAVHQNQKGGAAQIGVKNKDTEDSNQAEPQRPVNPFAKSSSSKEQSLSLLDYIKK